MTVKHHSVYPFFKENEGDNGEEQLAVYEENGYVVIESEYGETHSYWLGKKELEELIDVLQGLQEDVYRK